MFSILATSKVISEQVSTCTSAHSWRLYSVAPLGDQAATTMTWHPIQSHYAESTNPCFILIIPSIWRGCDKYHFSNHWFDPTRDWIPISQVGRWTLNSFHHPVWSHQPEPPLLLVPPTSTRLGGAIWHSVNRFRLWYITPLARFVLLIRLQAGARWKYQPESLDSTNYSLVHFHYQNTQSSNNCDCYGLRQELKIQMALWVKWGPFPVQWQCKFGILVSKFLLY